MINLPFIKPQVANQKNDIKFQYLYDRGSLPKLDTDGEIGEPGMATRMVVSKKILDDSRWLDIR